MTTLDVLAERVAAGEPLSERDAQLMLDTPDLISVGVIADAARRRVHGARTTFVRVFEVHVDAPPIALPARVAAGELRIVGTPSSLDQAVGAVRATAALAAGVPVSGFSLADLESLVPGSLRATCDQLRAAGLECVAALPIDRLSDPQLAVTTAREAGLLVLRVTADVVAAGQRIASAVRARDLQSAVGGLQAFAPLPRAVDITAPSTGYDDVKHVAVARVLASNIPSIQVDWVQYGPKLAQVALTVGADDVDGVAATDPGVLGTRRSPLAEIQGNIRAAGLEPAERDGRFRQMVQT